MSSAVKGGERLSNTRPLRVLHIIDGLAGGGSERLLWDIIRLSERRQVEHRVVTTFLDDGSFVYAERLRQAGVYSPPEQSISQRAKTFVGNRLSPGLKQPIRRVLHRSRASRSRVFPSASTFENSNNSGMDAVFATALQRITEEFLHFQPDVITAHLSRAFALGLGAKTIFGRPMVYVVPCLLSQLEDAGVGFLQDEYRKFHPWVDRFFTAYPAELIGLGISEGKISKIGGLVDLEGIERVKSQREFHRREIRRALGVEESALIALSVGRFHHSKGHEYALSALPSLINRFPDLHWIAIGAGTEEVELLKSQAQTLGASQHAHILGFVPDPLPYYAASDIYFRTPIMEGDNLSSYQAMAMGIPVVGFDTGQETELVTKVGHGILVPPKDANAIAAAAESILSLSDRGRSLGQRGSDYSQAHLDLNKVISAFLTCYLDLGRSYRHAHTNPE